LDVPRDLENGCLMAMAKAPGRRYASACAFAEDLGRFKERKPMLARPVGLPERLGRWCRRNPALATARGLAAMLLVTPTAISVGWAAHADQLAQAVRSALDDSEQRRAENYLDRGLAEAEHGDIGLGLLWMVRGLKTVPAKADDLGQT